MSDSDENQWNLTLPFLNETKDFALGFECGKIWIVLQSESEPDFETDVHQENFDQIVMMAGRTGWLMEHEEMGGGWVIVKFRRRG